MNRRYLMAGMGVWLIVDGVASIAAYHKQTLKENMIRVIRTGIGVALIVLSIL